MVCIVNRSGMKHAFICDAIQPPLLARMVALCHRYAPMIWRQCPLQGFDGALPR
jgi:hypothetical protein